MHYNDPNKVRSGINTLPLNELLDNLLFRPRALAPAGEKKQGESRAAHPVRRVHGCTNQGLELVNE